MYANLYKPLPLLLGVWSLACSVSMILLMEQAVLVQHLSLLQRWIVVKRLAFVIAATMVMLAVKIHLAVPWWYAVLSWLMCFNAKGSVYHASRNKPCNFFHTSCCVRGSLVSKGARVE
jgi:hypothetical protein